MYTVLMVSVPDADVLMPVPVVLCSLVAVLHETLLI